MHGFLGVSQHGPSFVFTGHLQTTASQVYQKISQNESQTILEGIGKGLEFLHCKCIVHLELSLDTVFLDEVTLNH